jgi:hypothetical protein
MRIQIIVLAIASTISVQIAVARNPPLLPRYDYSRRDSAPVYRHPADYNRPGINAGYIQRPVGDEYNRVREQQVERKSAREISARTIKEILNEHYTITESEGNGKFETVRGFVIIGNKKDNNSGKDNIQRPMGDVVEAKTTPEVPFATRADERIREDKKEIKEAEKIVKKDIDLLKKIEKIESSPLGQKQALKAAQLEERVIDQINREQKRIEDLKADQRSKKDLKKIVEEATKIQEQLSKKTEAERSTTQVDPIVAEFERKMNSNLALEQAQKKLLPSLLSQMLMELRRKTDNQRTAPTQFGNGNEPRDRVPEPKMIMETQPLRPETPVAEKVAVIVQKSRRNRKEGPIIVGGIN